MRQPRTSVRTVNVQCVQMLATPEESILDYRRATKSRTAHPVQFHRVYTLRKFLIPTQSLGMRFHWALPSILFFLNEIPYCQRPLSQVPPCALSTFLLCSICFCCYYTLNGMYILFKLTFLHNQNHHRNKGPCFPFYFNPYPI